MTYEDLLRDRLRNARLIVQHYREGSLRPTEFEARGEAAEKRMDEAISLLRAQLTWQHAAAYNAAKKALRCVAPDIVARYHPDGFADRMALLEAAEDFMPELEGELSNAHYRKQLESVHDLALPPGWSYDPEEGVIYAANSVPLEGEIGPDRAEDEAWGAFGIPRDEFEKLTGAA